MQSTKLNPTRNDFTKLMKTILYNLYRLWLQYGVTTVVWLSRVESEWLKIWINTYLFVRIYTRARLKILLGISRKFLRNYLNRNEYSKNCDRKILDIQSKIFGRARVYIRTNINILFGISELLDFNRLENE